MKTIGSLILCEYNWRCLGPAAKRPPVGGASQIPIYTHPNPAPVGPTMTNVSAVVPQTHSSLLRETQLTSSAVTLLSMTPGLSDQLAPVAEQTRESVRHSIATRWSRPLPHGLVILFKGTLESCSSGNKGLSCLSGVKSFEGS